MNILKTNDFISERVKIQPATNADFNEATKPDDKLQNIEEFKYWLSYYKYEFEVQETGWGNGDGQKIAVKDKKRPQYTIFLTLLEHSQQLMNLSIV